jgi:diguanylate cyclase (GGDEF)-like protein
MVYDKQIDLEVVLLFARESEGVYILIEYRKFEVRNIPKFLWVVIVICYILPFGLEFYIYDTNLEDSLVAIVWFICLIPSLIFSYYKGLKGGIFSITFTTLLHIASRIIIEDDIYNNRFENYLQLEVIIANILVTFPVCFLVNKLHVRNFELVVAYKELTKKQNEISRLSYIDFLTQLPNRRFLEENLLKNLNEVSQNNETLCILFIDLDGFKEVNDTFGHSVGDTLLQQVASMLKRYAVGYDYTVRLSGDEFILVLPKANKQKAIEIASKILDELKKPFVMKDSRITVTPSIGIAIYPEHGDDSETLIKHADKAMYQAKKDGKNNYAVYETETSG